MKKITILLPLVLLMLASACKKDEEEFQPSAGIYVLNMAMDLGTIKVNPAARSGFAWSRSVTQVAYGSGLLYQSFTGNQNITMVKAADTNSMVFSKAINLQPINSIYLIGQAPTIDTMIRVERNLPFIDIVKVKPDSSIYVRFINLSPDSGPVNFTVANTPAGVNETVSNISYKGISDFIKIPAKIMTSSGNYTVTVKDAATGTQHLSYSLATNTNRHKTISLIYRGKTVGGTGTNAPGISLFSYF